MENPQHSEIAYENLYDLYTQGILKIGTLYDFDELQKHFPQNTEYELSDCITATRDMGYLSVDQKLEKILIYRPLVKLELLVEQRAKQLAKLAQNKGKTYIYRAAFNKDWVICKLGIKVDNPFLRRSIGYENNGEMKLHLNPDKLEETYPISKVTDLLVPLSFPVNYGKI